MPLVSQVVPAPDPQDSSERRSVNLPGERSITPVHDTDDFILNPGGEVASQAEAREARRSYRYNMAVVDSSPSSLALAASGLLCVAASSSSPFIHLYHLNPNSRKSAPISLPSSGSPGKSSLAVTALCFSPCDSFLSVGTSHGDIYLYSLEANQIDITLPPSIYQPHQSPVSCMAYFPSSSNFIIASSHDTTLSITDVSSPSNPLILEGHSSSVTTVSASCDNAFLASGSVGSEAKVGGTLGKVQIWEVEWSDPLLREGEGSSTSSIVSTSKYHTFSFNSAVTSVQFSPSCPHHILTATHDGDVTVHDILRKTAHLTLSGGHALGSVVAHASYSNRASMIVTSGDDESICLWDGYTGAFQIKISTSSSSSKVTAASIPSRTASFITPDELSVVTCSRQGVVVFDPTEGNLPTVFRCSSTNVDFSPDGKHVFVGSKRGHIRAFDAVTGAEGVLFSDGALDHQGHKANLTSLEVSPTGKLLATGGLDGQAFIWDAFTGDLLTKLTPPKYSAPSSSSSSSHRLSKSGELFQNSSQYVVWKDESTVILSSISVPGIFVFHIEELVNSTSNLRSCTATLVQTINFTSADYYFGEIAYNRRIQLLAATSTIGETVVFDLRGDSVAAPPLNLSHPFPNDSLDTTSVAWSPDGSLLAVASINSGPLKIYKRSQNFNLACTVEPRVNSSGALGIVDMSFSYCGRFLAVIGADGRCVVHDAAHITRHNAPQKSHGEPLMVVVESHLRGALASCRFSPNSDQIFVGGSTVTNTRSKIVSTGSLTHNVLSSIVREIFFEDVTAEKVARTTQYDWKTMSLISSHITKSNWHLLCRGNRLGRNLVHTASKNNVHGFLEAFLDTSWLSFDPPDGSLVVEMSSAAAAVSACLMRDYDGKTPLWYALESENTSSVEAILKCILLSFDSRLSTLSLQRATQQHLSDLFPLADFLRTLIDHPAVGLRIMSKLMAVPNYSHLVMKNCDDVRGHRGMLRIFGSRERAPDAFWLPYFYPDKAAAKKVEKTEIRSKIMFQLNRSLSFAADGSLSSFEDEVPEDDVVIEEASAKHTLPMKTTVVPIPHAAGCVTLTDTRTKTTYSTTLLKEIVLAVSKTENYDVFDQDNILREIIEFKWRSYIRVRFVRSLVLNLIMIFAYTVDALQHAVTWRDHNDWVAAQTETDSVMMDEHVLNASSGMDMFMDEPRGGQHNNHKITTSKMDVTTAKIIPTIVTLLLWMYFVNHERQQAVEKFKLSKRKWAELLTWRNLPPILVFRHASSSIWNTLDVLSLQLIALTYMVRLYEYSISMEAFGASSITIAFGLPVCYINLLKYLQGFQSSGELVSMIVAIIRGIKIFLLILFTIMVGFALGFYVLFSAGTRTVDGVCGEDGVFLQNDWASALLNSFTLLLGDFDMEEYTASYSFVASSILFVFFMFLVNVVMLNLLIAIMGDIFDSVQQHAKAQYLFSKACLILEYESVMRKTHKNDEELFPKFLQIAKTDDDTYTKRAGTEEDSWAGRLRSIKTYIKNGLHSQVGENRLFRERWDAESLVLENKIKGIEADVAALSADVHEMKGMLKELLRRK